MLQARDRADEADNGVTVAYSIPKEGALMWFDSFGIPGRRAASRRSATPSSTSWRIRRSPRATRNYVYYANGNKDSQQYLSEDVSGDPAIYPDQATMDKLFTTTPNDPKVQRIVTRTWTRVKSGRLT